ncbi:CRAL-TRIO domain-containing protein [Cladochytrium replicatum]|nr:CRAL-TRIO domain-containing protein [Cladochytrium replicatum]
MSKQIDVGETLKTHADEIQKLKKNLASEIAGSTFYDDIFILRFILSNGSTAEVNLRETIKWRRENAKALEIASTGGPPPHDDIVGRLCVMDFHGTTSDGSPLLIIRSGLTNVPDLMSRATPEQIGEWMLIQREEGFAICDAATRKSGKLVKLIVVNDFQHAKMLGADRRFFKGLGMASKGSETYYPQLLGIQVMINPPSWMNMVFPIAKLFMSKRTLDKIKVCPGIVNSGTDLSKCPFLSTYLKADDFPTFLGGNCTCSDKGGCIRGVDNNRITPVIGIERVPSGNPSPRVEDSTD